MKTKNMDVLFYVENNMGIVTPGQIHRSKNEIGNIDPGVVRINQGGKRVENRISQIENLIPVEKDIFQSQILNVTNFFNELIPQIPNDGKESNPDLSGYVLDQIEVNLSAEISGGLKFVLAAKGNAGIKIIFKRR